MKQLKSGGALEPTSIDKISPAERFGPDPPYVRSMIAHMQAERDRYFASPLMRRMGITRHPANCTHERKKFADYAMKWVCMDCGEDL